ncbi:MAG: tetratricopeptide repeat protein [Holophagales bacterium]|nr:tetratricopeptide repeat protein [Holophagales bacterium]
MSGSPRAGDEESLVRRAEALVRDGAARPLPDEPALGGVLFADLLDRLDESTVDRAARAAIGEMSGPSDALGPGARLGSVRIESLLGEGGMGRVYRGFDEKLGRPIAVKTIRARTELSAAARARFRREARLLSRLNHPSICQVYDLLERPEGHYLLLELVEGETLRDWLGRGPTESQRLATAIAIADAVAAAHRAGVVHRDLKPDNVMCLSAGGVKVLDFGIARAEESSPAEEEPASGGATSEISGGGAGATDGFLAALTGYRTELGSIVGTPAYMSPEQARGEPVEAASDIWAMGVLCHEVFAGRRPFVEERPTIATLRSPEIRLDPELDAELSRLLAAMLETDPLVRPTAEAAAARLRWIAARPVRRRRWIVAAVAAALVFLGVARYVVDVRAERAAAVTARDEAEEIVGFLVSIFEVADPRQSLGEEVTARQLLDRGAARVAELGERPVVRARLEATLGAVYTALGLDEEATAHLERALRARRSLLGVSDPETLATAVRWAEVELRRGRVEEAERDADAAIGRVRTLGSGAKRDELLLDALDVRSTARRQLARLAEAEADRREALALAEAGPGSASVSWAAAASGLALVLFDQGRAAEAEPLARQALEVFERSLPESHPDRNAAMNNLALILTDIGRSEEALEIQREELALDIRALGPGHPAVGISHDNVALALFRLGRLEEAEGHVRRAVEIFKAAGGESHLNLATAYHNLGVLARELGRPDEAIGHLRRAVAIYRGALGDRTPQAAGSLRALAAVYERQQRYAEALPILAEAWALEEALQAEGSEPSIATLCRLARAQAGAGQSEVGERTAREALELGESAWSVRDERLAPALEALAEILEAKGDAVAAAEARARRADLAAGG